MKFVSFHFLVYKNKTEIKKHIMSLLHAVHTVTVSVFQVPINQIEASLQG